MKWICHVAFVQKVRWFGLILYFSEFRFSFSCHDNWGELKLAILFRLRDIFYSEKFHLLFFVLYNTHTHRHTQIANVHLFIRHWGLFETKYFISLNIFHFCFSLFCFRFLFFAIHSLDSWINKNFFMYFSPFCSHHFRFISILLTKKILCFSSIDTVQWIRPNDLFMKFCFYELIHIPNIGLYEGATSTQYGYGNIGLTNEMLFGTINWHFLHTKLLFFFFRWKEGDKFVWCHFICFFFRNCVKIVENYLNAQVKLLGIF